MTLDNSQKVVLSNLNETINNAYYCRTLKTKTTDFVQIISYHQIIVAYTKLEAIKRCMYLYSTINEPKNDH